VGAACALALAMGANPAGAQAVSARATLADRITYDDNPLMAEDPDGYVWNNTAMADLGVDLRGPRLTLGLTGGADHNTYSGPGADAIPDSTNYRAGVTLDSRGPRIDYGARANYRREAVQQAEVLDTGATTGNADRISKSVGATIGYQRNSRDRIEGNAGFEDVDFRGDPDPTGRRNPYDVTTLGGAFIRQLTPRDTFTAEVTGTFMDADDAVNTRSQTYEVNGLLERQRSPAITTRIGAGFGLIQREFDDEDDADIRLDATDTSLTFLAGITYTIPRVTLSFDLENGFEPTARGTMAQRLSATGEAAYELRQNLTTTFTVQYSAAWYEVDFLPSGSADRSYLTVGPGIAWRFLPDWTLSAGYRFRHLSVAEGDANGNQIFAQLSWSPTLLR
jgi:hypothetical protein